MKLYSSPASPFGRKVKIVAGVKGLESRIETVVADASKGDPELDRHNPLGKIPCLVVDGSAIYDSHVICEYLDATGAGPVLIPRVGPERWRTLTLAALADGILEAALLLVYEKRYRPEDKQVEAWTARQWGKINSALHHLERSPPEWASHPDYGHITLACGLGYLDFRHAGTWRPAHPKLVAWLDRFAATMPAYAATAPPR